LIEVLKATGLAEDQIKALQELPDEVKDFKPESYTQPIYTAAETRLKNDPKFYDSLNKENLPKEFLEKFRAENYGATAAVVRQHLLRGSGMTEKDFADMGEDFKKMDLFTPAFIKKVTEGKVGDKELQAKLIEANQEIVALKAKTPELETKYKTEFELKVQELAISNAVVTALSSVQGLKAPVEFVNEKITAILKSKYALVSENGIVEVRQKDKPTLKALTANNTKELSLTEAINQILDERELIDKKATTREQQHIIVGSSENGLKISKHVKDKIDKLKAEDKVAAGG